METTPASFCFTNFMERAISRKLSLGRTTTARNYGATLKSFAKFLDGKVLHPSKLTSSVIEKYQTWLSDSGISLNSISFYMRNLRAVYNMAVDRHITIDRHPFRKAYTGIGKTEKRAVTIADISSIRQLDLNGQPQLELARDIFMFLFYCRGMSFIDAAYLTAENISGNYLIYRRHKTGQTLRVGLNSHITRLIDKWSRPPYRRCHNPQPSHYLLPVLNSQANASRKSQLTQYQSSLRRTNKHLKTIAAMARINANLTTYVTRHSWASIARNKGIPIATISDALGHDSELTTQIYLAAISTDTIDRANDLILNSL